MDTENNKQLIYEIIQRCEQGPAIEKNIWDFDHVMQVTRKLVKKFNLFWDPQEIIPQDTTLINRCFEAGLELAQKTGVYYYPTRKVIYFSQQEIENRLKATPQVLSFGEGKDEYLLRPRKILDSTPPAIWAGNPGVPTPENLFLAMVMSWMKEPIVDLVTCGSLTHIDNNPIKTGEVLEILGTRRELEMLHEGLKKVNRPGMGLLAAQSSVSELGDLAVLRPELLRPCDAHLVPMLNELILDRQHLIRAVNSLDYGVKNASLATVMVGGLAGNAPGAAVVQIASFLLSNLVCLADYHLLHPIHIRHVATSTREVMWVQSVVSQAFARNAPSVIVADIYPKSGAMTSELLFEVAANSIVATVSGSHLEGVGSADGALPNCSGLEARWMGEIGHAVTKQQLSLTEANRIVNKLLNKYEYVFKLLNGNPGQPFDKVYDLETLEPTKEWENLYNKVKEEVHKIGLSGIN